STRPAAFTAATSVLKSPAFTAVSTMSLLAGSPPEPSAVWVEVQAPSSRATASAGSTVVRYLMVWSPVFEYSSNKFSQQLINKHRVPGGYFRELKKNATAVAVALVGGRS